MKIIVLTLFFLFFVPIVFAVEINTDIGGEGVIINAGFQNVSASNQTTYWGPYHYNTYAYTDWDTAFGWGDPSLTYVPYTGATENVNLGTYNLTAGPGSRFDSNLLIQNLTGNSSTTINSLSNHWSCLFLTDGLGAGLGFDICSDGAADNNFVIGEHGNDDGHLYMWIDRDSNEIVFNNETEVIGNMTADYYYGDGTYLTGVANSSGYIPYVGATNDVNLGVHGLTAQALVGDSLSIDQVSIDINTISSIGTDLILDSGDTVISFRVLTAKILEVDDSGVDVTGDVNASGVICDSNGCIGSGSGNPFNQVLNTTSNVTFGNITAENNITAAGVICDSNGCIGSGNPFDQVLNTTSEVTFTNITASENVTAQFYYGDGSQLTGIQTGNLILFFLNDTGDVGGNRTLSTTRNATKVELSGAGLPDGNTLMGEWITEMGVPGLSYLPTGTWYVHVHGQQTGGTKTSQFFYEVLVTDENGENERSITTSDYSNALMAIEEEFDMYKIFPETDLNTTDRIKVKGYAYVSGVGSAPSVSAFIQGDAETRLEIPVGAVSIANFVPYTGAIKSVDMGVHNLTAHRLISNYYSTLNDKVIINYPDIPTIGPEALQIRGDSGSGGYVLKMIEDSGNEYQSIRVDTSGDMNFYADAGTVRMSILDSVARVTIAALTGSNSFNVNGNTGIGSYYNSPVPTNGLGVSGYSVFGLVGNVVSYVTTSSFAGVTEYIRSNTYSAGDDVYTMYVNNTNQLNTTISLPKCTDKDSTDRVYNIKFHDGDGSQVNVTIVPTAGQNIDTIPNGNIILMQPRSSITIQCTAGTRDYQNGWIILGEYRGENITVE